MRLSILILAAAASTSKCGGTSDIPYLGCSAQGVVLPVRMGRPMDSAGPDTERLTGSRVIHLGNP
jgi:hypothetical protein